MLRCEAARHPQKEEAKQCGVLARAWRAHNDNIVKIKKISDPSGFITCGADKHVKLWSVYGELWGDIYLLRENY